MVKTYIQSLLESLHLLLEHLQNGLTVLLSWFQFYATGCMSCNRHHLFEWSMLKSLKWLIGYLSQKPMSTWSNIPGLSQWATPSQLHWISHQSMAGVCLPELQPWSVHRRGFVVHSPRSSSPDAPLYHLEALTRSSQPSPICGRCSKKYM